jgi:hypothetical protein
MVKLQLLLQKPNRTPEGISAATAAVEALGLHVTGAGTTTLSVEAEPGEILRVFGTPMPSKIDLNTPPLPVPASLRAHVQSITIAPNHLYFETGPI